jgi:hypothetical protein
MTSVRPEASVNVSETYHCRLHCRRQCSSDRTLGRLSDLVAGSRHVIRESQVANRMLPARLDEWRKDESPRAGAFTLVIDDFWNHYVPTYPPRGVAASGFHTIAVGLNGHRGEIRARRGYLR